MLQTNQRSLESEKTEINKKKQGTKQIIGISDMVKKPTNAYKYKNLSYILKIVFIIHTSAILRKLH